MSKAIYISGPITGKNLTACHKAFKTVEEFLKSCELKVVNPLNIGQDDPNNWHECMVRDLTILIRDCDSIFMLKGWENSKGARIEHFIATELKFKIYYE